MNPFVIGGKCLQFDITNADDLSRLQDASAVLEDACTALSAESPSLTPAEEMRRVYGMYRTFFGTLFPGREDAIVGEKPSAAAAKQAFAAWIAYLHESIDAARKADEAICAMYLGGGEVRA